MKRLLSLLLAFALIFACAPVAPMTANAATSGTCGDNLTWTLDNAGTLTISGTGAMKNYSYSGSPWYNSRSSIKSVIIDKGVTSIGNYAFYNCSNLERVVIGDSVTSIGDYAFFYCSSLTSVVIGDSVTIIGNYAFSSCSSLESVTIPDSMIGIGYCAFNDCSSLTGIWVDENNTKYCSDEQGVLYNKTKTTLIQAPGGITGSYTILDSVTSIGDRAFSSCSSLTSIDIPDSVTIIGNYAFSDCSSLESVTIPDSMIGIGYCAFNDCSSLTGIWVDENNTEYCSDEQGVLYNKTKTTLIQAPGGITGSYTILDSVTSIGSSAFRDCSSLTSVVIGDSVTNIGNYAFSSCSSLTSIVVPDSVTSIGDEAFQSCSSLTSVVIGDSVTSIGDVAFYNCSSLTSIEIPDSVTSIGDAAFESCRSLTSIEIPDSVISIGDDVFYNCSSLTSIEIPDSVISIGDDVFYNCGNLTSVEIGDSVTSIGDDVFYNCGNLTSVEIGDSVTSIGDYAFYYCSSLTSVVIPDSVISIGGSAFYYCSSLTSVVIPDSVISIGGSAFSECSSLTSVAIPDSVTSIGTYAFYKCSSLTSVVIPDSVISIGYDAFYNCSSLSHVAYTGTQSQWNDISIGSYNTELTNATRHYETSFEIVDNCVESSVYCPVCKEFITRTEKENHQETTVPGYAPTCTESGLTDGSVCTLCGEVVTQQVEIPATGHSTIDGVCQNCDYGKNAVHIQGDAETFYSTFEKAFAAATSGTVKLLADVNVGTIILKPGITLDLNGYTLTADFVVVMDGATILDGGTACTGGGKLQIAEKSLAFVRENGQGIIPVWNGVDGYVFTKVTFQQMARTAGEGAAQYIFMTTLSNPDAVALLADGGADNAVKVKVGLTWAGGQCQQFYTYSEDLVSQVFESNGKLVFSLTITGIAGIDDMTANAMVVTDSGTQATNTSTAIKVG